MGWSFGAGMQFSSGGARPPARFRPEVTAATVDTVSLNTLFPSQQYTFYSRLHANASLETPGINMTFHGINMFDLFSSVFCVFVCLFDCFFC